jgi:hypothetical protein
LLLLLLYLLVGGVRVLLVLVHVVGHGGVTGRHGGGHVGDGGMCVVAMTAAITLRFSFI